ncbi:sulfate reduction electron transfer complex DsrMKJOP subunit DsrP [Candidatus Hydrogenedentota bacterium]
MKTETKEMIQGYFAFLRRAVVLSFSGSPVFFGWMTILTIISVLGGYFYVKQFAIGLVTSGLTDEVSWGVYVANFTFTEGLATAVVMLVIPAYIYKVRYMQDVVIFGQLLSLAAIIMVLMFVMVDLGRPDRFWHMFPFVGFFNFPGSMLSWDVVVLNGYLGVNTIICSYLLYMRYLGREPKFIIYMPLVLVAIVWAFSIHMVGSFLFVGLVGRPFWSAAIVAPRFMGSAFTAGPAFLILVFQLIRYFTNYSISDRAIHSLRNIVTVALLLNMFLLASETFKEFYAASLHSSSARYLFMGLEGHNRLMPWIWTAVVLEVFAAIVLVVPPIARRIWFLNAACVFAIIGIWVEKGLGLIVPGFVPTPLGDIIEYSPTLDETLICMGIWAFGLLLFSWMLSLAVPIMSGRFHSD